MASQNFLFSVKTRLESIVSIHNADTMKLNTTFGAVRNAIGVMTSRKGCYFKFSKKSQGGGSIWDFAATRLFFEELGLWVSNTDGKPLKLNNPQTTFMNEEGVLFATEVKLAKEAMEIINSY